MRVLVISLLRLGDFLQTLPALQALKPQLGAREVDVLTFTPVQQLSPMISGIDRWFTLNRDELQAGLGRADIPLLTSFAMLKEQLDQINGREYDLVINLTQTEFSAWIAGYIQTTNRLGVFFDLRGEARFHSPWFQYLDDHAPVEVEDIFHYTDIFYYGCGLKGSARNWDMHETRRGQSELAALGPADGERIVLQLYTSDEKKTWPETSWLAMLTELQLFHPHAEFVLLGSPVEAERMEPLYQLALHRGLRVKKAIFSLEGAFSLLNQAQLLITGDTSIKHLANAAALPIVELSLGSSDWRRTGAYHADSLLLQPQVTCAPCAHSAPCRMLAHDCALTLNPSIVAVAAHHRLDGNWRAISDLAREYQGVVAVLRTRILSNGFWLACDVNKTAPENLVSQIVERSTLKFLLNREHLNPLAQFGSEGVFIRNEMQNLTDVEIASFSPHLDFLENRASDIEETAARLLNSVKRRRPELAEIRAFIMAQDSRSRALPWLERLQNKDPDGIVEIGGLRRVHTQLEKVAHHARLKVKLIRSLKSQIMESK